MKTARLAAALSVALLFPLAHGDPAEAGAATEGQVTLLAPVRAGGESATYRGRIYFQGTTPANGTELWSTDGTPDGTRLVVDLSPGAGNSLPQHLVVYGDRLFFTATTVTGNELWSTDGSAAGTQQAADIFEGAGSSFPASPVVVGSRLYFSAYEPTFGRELWSYEPGLKAHIVDDIRAGASSSDPKELTAFGNRVVYSASAREGIAKPWMTVDGISMARRLDSMGATVDLSPRDFTRVGNRLVFAAGDAVSGVELWVTAGDADDAFGIRDIYPGATSSGLDSFVTLGDRALFRASTPTEGYELWSSDGTSAGTVQVKDIDPRAGRSSFPDALTVLGGQVIFTAGDGDHGREVWTTLGTAASTQLVLDVNPGPTNGTILDPSLGTHPVGGRLMFAGIDAFGQEPWVTDGTAAGTYRVANLAPGDSRPHDLGVVGNIVVFGASDGAAEALYGWSAVGSTVVATPKKKYSAKQARKKKVVVPVTVTSSLGTPLSGGTVVLTSKGRSIGTAALSNGTARVRITVRLRPGHRYQVMATWAGDLVAAGSASSPVTFKIKRKHR